MVAPQEPPEEESTYLKEYNEALIRKLESKFLQLEETKKTLSEKERYYRSLISNIHEDIMVIDRDCIITDVNDTFLSTSGYDRENVIGKYCYEILHKYHQPCTAFGEDCRLDEVFEKGQPARCLHEHAGKDGAKIWVDVLLSPLKDVNGRVIQVIETAHDITDLINVTDALKESEQRFRQTFENANVGVALLDLDGRLLQTNRRLSEILGYTREELENMTTGDLAHPEYAAATLKTVQCYQTGEADKTDSEKLFRHKDGHRIWVHESSSLVRSAAGEPAYIISHMQDITQRRKSQEALIESKERLALALDAANLGMWDFNPTTFEDSHFNALWFTMLGYEPEDLPHTAETWSRLMHPDDLDPTLRILKDHLAGRRSYSVDFRLRAKDGSYRWIHSTGKVTAWDNKGVPARMVGIHLDITDVKNAEENRIKMETKFRQTQKMEAIGTLAGGIAHDFNNILSSVIGYSELSLDKVQKGTKLHYNLQEVLNAGMRAKELVKQILAFSRQAKQKLQPVQVKLIVKEALKLLRPSLPATIEIRHNIESDEAVLADATQIHQILMNLCTNAGHAMREKGGILGISLSDVDLDADFAAHNPEIRPGVYQVLVVSDTGHGISADEMEKIFDPFYTTKRLDEGTGMGLSVVHGIVKSYGGAIKVDSEPGKGSTFKVYLPIIETKIEAKVEAEKALVKGTEHILFVDDEKPLVDIGKRMLEQLGYRVTTRTSSIEALALFKAKSDEFDLVVTDLTMPNMTGDELAGEMMIIKPEIPVILCTGYSSRITPEQAATFGIRAFVSKPMLRENISEIIRNVLDQK